jgi:hypothetical protein
MEGVSVKPCHVKDLPWNKEIAKTHNQWRCPRCNHWAIQLPKGEHPPNVTICGQPECPLP